MYRIIRAERTVNNEKVTDHHGDFFQRRGNESLRLSGLSVKKKNLFCLLGQRVAQAVAGDCIYDETVVEAWCGNHVFQAKGSTIVEAGYKKIDRIHSVTFSKRKRQKNRKMVFYSYKYSQGQRFHHVDTKVEKRFTSPPKPFSEDTLLSAMENAGKKEFDKETEKKGIGMVTRVGIIEKLVTSGYAATKERHFSGGG